MIWHVRDVRHVKNKVNSERNKSGLMAPIAKLQSREVYASPRLECSLNVEAFHLSAVYSLRFRSKVRRDCPSGYNDITS